MAQGRERGLREGTLGLSKVVTQREARAMGVSKHRPVGGACDSEAGPGGSGGSSLSNSRSGSSGSGGSGEGGGCGGNLGACYSFKVARLGAEAVKAGPPSAPCAASPPFCSKGLLSGVCPHRGPSAAVLAEVAVAERGKVEAGVGRDREAQEQRCSLSAPPASNRRR